MSLQARGFGRAGQSRGSANQMRADEKQMARHTYKIAGIPGDGIGDEVVSAGVEVLHAIARRYVHARPGLATRRTPMAG